MIAEQIIERAKEHGVAVHESKELVALLMQVELDDDIPPALYRAVAELFSVVISRRSCPTTRRQCMMSGYKSLILIPCLFEKNNDSR